MATVTHPSAPVSLLASVGDAFRANFAGYQVTIRFRDKILGGSPRNARLAEAWLKAKAGLDGDDLHNALVRHLREVGVEVGQDATVDEMQSAIEATIDETSTIGFKKDAMGRLYLESRCIKAAIKENVNINFAGQRWGSTKKGPKNFTAERVFVRPHPAVLFQREDKSYVTEPDGIEENASSIVGPQGPRSIITRKEYVYRPFMTFQFISLGDEIPEANLGIIFASMAENGLGATRSQSYGQFDVLAFDRIPVDKLVGEVALLEGEA